MLINQERRISRNNARYLAEQAKYEDQKAKYSAREHTIPPLLNLLTIALTAYIGHFDTTPGGAVEQPHAISVAIQEPAQK